MGYLKESNRPLLALHPWVALHVCDQFTYVLYAARHGQGQKPGGGLAPIHPAE
jgi:hypothetical protein